MLPAPETRFIELGENALYVTAQAHGMMEPLICLGDRVENGQPLMHFRDLYRMDTAPQVLTSATDGVVSILRTTPIVTPGDHLCVICPELPSALLTARMAAATA